jgi:hypothetical protein
MSDMTLQYDVVNAFEATTAVSSRKRRFEPGDVVTCDSGQGSPNVIIEADMSLYLVERSIFKACCRFRNDGGAGY